MFLHIVLPKLEKLQPYEAFLPWQIIRVAVRWN
jgi:hypothetical protein